MKDNWFFYLILFFLVTMQVNVFILIERLTDRIENDEQDINNCYIYQGEN